MQIKIADLSVDTENKKVVRGTEEIQLTKQEYKLLEYLAENNDGKG